MKKKTNDTRVVIRQTRLAIVILNMIYRSGILGPAGISSRKLARMIRQIFCLTGKEGRELSVETLGRYICENPYEDKLVIEMIKGLPEKNEARQKKK